MKSIVPDIKTDNAVRPDAGGVRAVFIPIFFSFLFYYYGVITL